MYQHRCWGQLPSHVSADLFLQTHPTAYLGLQGATRHFREVCLPWRRRSYLNIHRKLETVFFGGQLYYGWFVPSLAWGKHPSTAQAPWWDLGMPVALTWQFLSFICGFDVTSEDGLYESLRYSPFLNPTSRIINVQTGIDFDISEKETIEKQEYGKQEKENGL